MKGKELLHAAIVDELLRYFNSDEKKAEGYVIDMEGTGVKANFTLSRTDRRAGQRKVTGISRICKNNRFVLCFGIAGGKSVLTLARPDSLDIIKEVWEHCVTYGCTDCPAGTGVTKDGKEIS